MKNKDETTDRKRKTVSFFIDVKEIQPEQD